MAHRCILVVDDEPLVLMLAVEMLEDAGHLVVEAANGEAALRQLEAHPEINVLFTDINMPGMNGFVLAQEVNRRRPDVLLILTSGRVGLDKDSLTAACQFVPKPYRAEKVLALVDGTDGTA